MTYELHPLCTLFPRVSGNEFETLCADIKENGLRNPIVIHDGMILDGGNRYRACVEIGIEPNYVEFDGGNIVSFVLSANLHRRHLSPGQQAAIVASAQDWAKAQSHGGSRRGEDQAVTLPLEKAGNVTGLSTVADRAAQSGASDKTQRMADKVAKADPELSKQVAHGEISLPKALKKISPQKEQENHEEFDEKSIRAEMADEFDPVAEIEKAHKEIDQLTSIIESDDKLAAAMAEIKRLNALIEVIESQKRGFQSSENAAKQAAKMWKNKFEKLERQMKAAGLVEF